MDLESKIGIRLSLVNQWIQGRIGILYHWARSEVRARRCPSIWTVVRVHTMQLSTNTFAADPAVVATRARYRPLIRTSICATMASALVFGTSPIHLVSAQTLDEVVKQQLTVGGPLGQTRCFELINGDLASINHLTGSLRAFCNATMSQVPPVSTTSGGANATPTTAPGIIQRRLREQGSEDEEVNQTHEVFMHGAASADSITTYPFGLSLFVSVQFESLDKKATPFEGGYDSNLWRVTTGADYSFTHNLLGGLAFDYYNQNGDFNNGGGFNVDSYGVLAYGMWLPNERSFIQSAVGLAQRSYERSRFVNFSFFNDLEQIIDPNGFVSGRIHGDYDGSAFHAGVLAGYDHSFGKVTIGPRAGLEWVRLEYDDYSERGETRKTNFIEIPLGGDTGLELRFDDENETSLVSTVGAAASMAIRIDSDIFVSPQVDLAWKHQFKNDQRNIGVSFAHDKRRKKLNYQNEKPDRDFFVLSAGIVASLPNGIQLFGSYRTLLGHRLFDSNTGTLGFRMTF